MKLVPLCAVLLFFMSCSLESDPIEITEVADFTAQNEEEILEYLTANELVAQRSETGLHYIIENQGDGDQPTVNSDVVVVYKGYFLDGSSFDQSSDSGSAFNLQQVILGWTEGITYFNEGGSGILLIPAHLAYGSFTTNGIPGGSVLIFEIELLTVD